MVDQVAAVAEFLALEEVQQPGKDIQEVTPSIQMDLTRLQPVAVVVLGASEAMALQEVSHLVARAVSEEVQISLEVQRITPVAVAAEHIQVRAEVAEQLQWVESVVVAMREHVKQIQLIPVMLVNLAQTV
jgi:hypothetical protein